MTQVTKPGPPADLQVYTVDEAAALLKMSRRQLYKLVEDRQISFRRTGKVAVRFTAKDIEDYLSNAYRPAVTR